jgi:hypothetical protein
MRSASRSLEARTARRELHQPARASAQAATRRRMNDQASDFVPIRNATRKTVNPNMLNGCCRAVPPFFSRPPQPRLGPCRDVAEPVWPSMVPHRQLTGGEPSAAGASDRHRVRLRRENPAGTEPADHHRVNKANRLANPATQILRLISVTSLSSRMRL